MPKLADRISYVMEQEHIDSVCDKALLLDYKAELAYMRKGYDVAVKKREKADKATEALPVRFVQ